MALKLYRRHRKEFERGSCSSIITASSTGFATGKISKSAAAKKKTSTTKKPGKTAAGKRPVGKAPGRKNQA